MTRTILFSALVGLFLTPAVSYGQSAKQQAKALYDQGSGHYKSGRYIQAIDAFKRAYQLKPIPVLLRTLAKVHEKLDDLPKAIDYYRRYLGTQPKDAAKIRPQVARLSATMATWPSLNLSSTPQGASVRVGSAQSRIYGRTPTTLRLAPKRQMIVVEKPGYRTVSRPILFEAGTHRSMTITLSSLQPAAPKATAAAAAAPIVAPIVPSITVPNVPKVAIPTPPPQVPKIPPPVAIPTPPIQPVTPSIAAVPPPVVGIPSVAGTASSDTSGGVDTRLWAWIGIGTGAALVLGGSITGAMAVGSKGDLDSCQSDPVCQRTQSEADLAGDVQSQALVTDVLIGTGALVAGGGLLLYFMGGDDSAGTGKPTVTLVPTPVGATAIGQIRF